MVPFRRASASTLRPRAVDGCSVHLSPVPHVHALPEVEWPCHVDAEACRAPAPWRTSHAIKACHARCCFQSTCAAPSGPRSSPPVVLHWLSTLCERASESNKPRRFQHGTPMHQTGHLSAGDDPDTRRARERRPALGQAVVRRTRRRSYHPTAAAQRHPLPWRECAAALGRGPRQGLHRPAVDDLQAVTGTRCASLQGDHRGTRI